ncbi:MAG: hypothetical protein E7614_04065 [Ruminococcaceae bacterium]|nr:hypothetical protein [Oscillospiraceae bacterium]
MKYGFDKYINKGLTKALFLFVAVMLFSALTSFSADAQALSADYEGASDAFADALREGKSSVSVVEFNIPKDEAGFLLQFSQSHNTDVFWYPLSISYNFSDEDNIIAEIEWENVFEDFSQIEAMQKDFEKYAKEAVNVCFDRNMTDFEKILSAHEYLTEFTTYTLTDDYSFTAYSVFVRGEGVCQGYSYAFKYLMDAVGIECHYVSSNTLDHGWNIVKLDGEYYHVDVTGNDAVAKYNGVEIKHGRQKHTKLLCSDAALNCGVDDVKIWSDIALPECKSTLYDNAFYKNITGSMEFIDGFWYYIEPNEYINGSRRVLKTDGEKTEVFLEMKKPVYAISSHGKEIYCAVKDVVYKVDLDGKYKEFCSTVGEIFGCAIREDELYYGVYRKKSYAVCSVYIPKNLDCIEGVNLDVTSETLALNIYVKDFIELKDGFIKYTFDGEKFSVSMKKIDESRVISVPVNLTQLDLEIEITVVYGEEEKKYTTSALKYLTAVSKTEADSKTLNVVKALLEYSGINEPSEVTVSGYETKISDSSDEISFISAELAFDGKVDVKLKFSVLGKVEFKSNGKIKVEKDGLYYTVTVLDISAFDLEAKFKVIAKDVSVKFNVLGLISNCDEETKKEILAFYNYGKALSEYSK